MSHSEDDVNDMATMPVQADEQSTTCQPSKTDIISPRDPNMILTSSAPAAVASGHSEPFLNPTSAPRTPKGRAYGSAQVYANTERRNLNSGFEILPAGTLGARPELQIRDPSLQQPGQER